MNSCSTFPSACTQTSGNPFVAAIKVCCPETWREKTKDLFSDTHGEGRNESLIWFSSSLSISFPKDKWSRIDGKAPLLAYMPIMGIIRGEGMSQFFTAERRICQKKPSCVSGTDELPSVMPVSPVSVHCVLLVCLFLRSACSGSSLSVRRPMSGGMQRPLIAARSLRRSGLCPQRHMAQPFSSRSSITCSTPRHKDGLAG